MGLISYLGMGIGALIILLVLVYFVGVIHPNISCVDTVTQTLINHTQTFTSIHTTTHAAVSYPIQGKISC